MSYLPPGTFIAVTLVFTGILIFETVRYAIKVKRGEIGKQSWLYAMPAFIFCAIFAAVERFFRAYIPGPVSDVLSKIQLFLPLLIPDNTHLLVFPCKRLPVLNQKPTDTKSHHIMINALYHLHTFCTLTHQKSLYC